MGLDTNQVLDGLKTESLGKTLQSLGVSKDAARMPTYLLGALVAVVMAYSLAEMAVVHPVAGSFGIYASRERAR